MLALIGKVMRKDGNVKYRFTYAGEDHTFDSLEEAQAARKEMVGEEPKIDAGYGQGRYMGD